MAECIRAEGPHIDHDEVVRPECWPNGTMPKMEIHYNDDGWAALYVDGTLDSFNDANVTEDRAMTLAGIDRLWDTGFMRDSETEPAPTLDDVRRWEAAHPL